MNETAPFGAPVLLLHIPSLFHRLTAGIPGPKKCKPVNRQKQNAESRNQAQVNIYDLAFKPDGSELLVAADNRILVYDAQDGNLLQTLKGHKDYVFCVCYSHDGEKFASGSADRSVILWTEQHEGTLKYSHADPIQCIAFSPITVTLLSVAINDFGVWTTSNKSVAKQKVPNRLCSCAWSTDGLYYALGAYNGTVSVRSSQSNEEAHRFSTNSAEPIWKLAFSPRADFGPPSKKSQSGADDSTAAGYVIVAASWDQTLNFFDLEGTPLGKEIALKYDVCAMNFFSVGDFLLLGGSNRQLSLHSREGQQLGVICQTDNWVWAVATRPRTQHVVVGSVDGTLACYQLLFSTVHGLHKERYAYRENMTDVVVQDLSRDMRVSVRIRCKDLVRKVAVYHHRLAIQLADRVNIYRQVSGDRETEQLEYRIIERIAENFECSLLVVCSQHLILCQERRLQCYDFRGLKIREWILDALIRYIKVIGGPPGRESILVGLKNGEVARIFVDNPFAVKVLQINSSVRCLDISVDRHKLAVVDEHSTCLVYDARNGQLLYQEPNANSVAWNSEHKDLLCFSGNGALSIKAQDFMAYQQRMQGFVVGFSGKRVFCLHLYAMTSLEVPLSNQLYQYLERNMFTEAYELACLGATESDWFMLALSALHHFDLLTAKKAFHRIRNSKFLQLIHDIEQRQKRGEGNEQAFTADMLAYEGQFAEAAELYKECHMEQQALDMYTDLRMFELAQQLLSSVKGDTQKTLIRKRANWAENSNDAQTAAEMYMSAGDYDKAIEIMCTNNFLNMLINLARKLDRAEIGPLKQIAKFFVDSNEYTIAAEIYTTLNDLKSLMHMYVQAHLWDDAFALCSSNPQFKDDVYLPYARWLAENDRFEDAQKAYHKAGRQQEALRVLEQLTENAVRESRFVDAGYYHWMLSMQYLDRAKEEESKQDVYLEKFRHSQQQADIYYAYHAIHRFLAEPFTSYQPDSLLNIARFVLHQLNPSAPTPAKVSLVNVLYTLSKQGNVLGAFKLARHCYERLQKLRAPARFQQLIELGCIQIRARPFHDNPDLQPMCYRCGTTNPLTVTNNQPQSASVQGNACVHCATPFVFSYISFDVLPLVQFEIVDGISDAEALELINAEPPLLRQANTDEVFARRTPNQKRSAAGGGANNNRLSPVKVDRDVLISLNKTEVIVCEWPAPLTFTYFKNLIPEFSISKCNSCNRLFHTDDFELAVLQEGRCPFCRSKNHPNLRGMSATFDDDD